MTRTRSALLGSAARPVAVPDDLGGGSDPRPLGRVELPRHLRWSGPPKTYDLDNRSDRARVYEQILREGTEDDVRRFVRADDLVELWDELVLPGHVRAAWSDWISSRRAAT